MCFSVNSLSSATKLSANMPDILSDSSAEQLHTSMAYQKIPTATCFFKHPCNFAREKYMLATRELLMGHAPCLGKMDI
jgi:hypothetical protein